jgi:hypothetical protein
MRAGLGEYREEAIFAELGLGVNVCEGNEKDQNIVGWELGLDGHDRGSKW